MVVSVPSFTQSFEKLYSDQNYYTSPNYYTFFFLHNQQNYTNCVQLDRPMFKTYGRNGHTKDTVNLTSLETANKITLLKKMFITSYVDLTPWKL